MVEIVYLKAGEKPQEEEYLHVVWKLGDGMKMEVDKGKTTQFVPSHLFDIMVAQFAEDAPATGRSRIYGTPRE